MIRRAAVALAALTTTRRAVRRRMTMTMCPMMTRFPRGQRPVPRLVVRQNPKTLGARKSLLRAAVRLILTKQRCVAARLKMIRPGVALP